LDEAVGTRWAAVRKQNDEEALRAFRALFAPQLSAGREAQLELAERLAAGDRAKVIEAELLLTQLVVQTEDGQHAARALEALARLMARRGFREDALHYYQQLARDYPTTVVRDGKKGADFLNDLSTDKRFLPYLGEKAPLSRQQKFRAEEERDKNFQ